jgi:predicted PurR-regulated permease PerM
MDRCNLEAIETAGYIVGHYLLLFTLTNLGYGLAIGTVVWLLGLPNPAFWAAIAFLLRFIPYVTGRRRAAPAVSAATAIASVTPEDSFQVRIKPSLGSTLMAS